MDSGSSTRVVMYYAPIGVFALIAVVVSQRGLGVLLALGKLILLQFGCHKSDRFLRGFSWQHNQHERHGRLHGRHSCVCGENLRHFAHIR